MHKLLFILLMIFPGYQLCKPTTKDVIMIMGQSCSGKSTLAKQLKKKLSEDGQIWKIVDFDDVGESLDMLIEQVNEYLENNTNVIIDINTYEKNLDSKLKPASVVIKIAVRAELDTLLQRDEIRSKNLNRDKNRVFWAKEFVKSSFEASKFWPYDFIICTDATSIDDCCLQVFDLYKNCKSLP